MQSPINERTVFSDIPEVPLILPIETKIDISQIKPRWEVLEMARIACAGSSLDTPKCDTLLNQMLLRYNRILDRNDIDASIEKMRILQAIRFGKHIRRILEGTAPEEGDRMEADEVMKKAVKVAELPQIHLRRRMIDFSAKKLLGRTEEDSSDIIAAYEALGFVRLINQIDPELAAREKEADEMADEAE